MWESVACVDFKFVDDGGGNWSSASSVGDIRVGGHVFDGRKVPGTPTKIAHGFFPPPNGRNTTHGGWGDLHFDSNEYYVCRADDPVPNSFFRGFLIFKVALHEIGHCLGEYSGLENHNGVTSFCRP
eukprot:Rmarinus@m.24960